MNAFLLYLAWFWHEFSLTRPVEVEMSVEGLAGAGKGQLRAFTVSPVTVVKPAGMQMNDVATTEELLPWEPLRAAVRRRFLQRLCERVEQAFGRPGASEPFERG